ncbi:gephyrin-like molybdotransferase Glp [Pararhodobacter sp. SW119]|uniref:molybdopterin-binding protein n=1 Tax=Pararhodobacter sp. SW119 TaxID=2780075 RepID=UPI001AE05374|nr:gephyrin-like molybdotransferase Glp [Pararhodobacter sp. SW119]
MRFDRIAIVDWSAANRPASGRDSIWIATAEGEVVESMNPRTRRQAEDRLRALIDRTLARGERMLIGADFAFGFPAGLAAALTGQAQALAVWAWLARQLRDDAENRSNRFEVAAAMNRVLPGLGPFWFRPAGLDLPDLPAQGRAREGHGMADLRRVDRRAPGAQSVFKLGGAGAVGSQTLTGLPVLWRLRAAHSGRVAVWPFDDCRDAPVVLAEVFPSLLRTEVAALRGSGTEPINDEMQVRLLALALAHLSARDALAPLFEVPPEAWNLAEEGWILGVGQEGALRRAAEAVLGRVRPPEGDAEPAPLTPPRLRNDCFAMPQGVSWVPVETALEKLRAALVPVTGTEVLPVAKAGGRVLAADQVARRSNPPRANSAVDGYGFAHAGLAGGGPYTLPLAAGRAAAGQPFAGSLPAGQAVRILTGAILPEGVDTVVLDEDCARDGARVAFDGPVMRGANTRRAGEDVGEGAPVLPAGRRLTPADLALLSALGIGRVAVRRALRVAVLSTGDEIVADTDAAAEPHQIYDANRPMLLDILRRWGHLPVDLGHAPDRPARLRAALDRGARRADVILTSGGASAGDEDHVARLLREEGQLSSWRIALKPGRPLALALWGGGVPVIGLPGNPVAALVCTLIFARPALSLMSGAGWVAAQGFTVPAAFAKRKKPGRREYLRARLNAEGAAEVFASEGSGRISGLSWAEGLVELPDGAAEIVPGTPVRYLPYASFGLG